ncbi:MAG: mechanosensitive ion channel family protein [Oscillospiraceae bacterium]|nr:mechanosensitive ion channel family protein [Oscillospiraceae bacterium]
MFALNLGSTALTNVISAVVIFVICLIVIKILSSVTEKMLNKSTKLDGTLRGFVQSAIKIVLWILAAIIVANALGINTSSLVALVSVVGLALSLSVQNILSNLFSGLTLLVTKPFAAGDFVEVAGKTGLVKTVGLFYTQLDTLDNVAVSLPNSDVTAASVYNYNREPKRRVDMYFSAAYDEPTEKVKAAIMEAINQDARILSDPAPFVRLFEYKGSAISYVVRVWCNNADYWDVYFDLNENVRESFQRNGVAMSYEHVNVHVVEK